MSHGQKIDWVIISSKPGELAYCQRCGEGLRLQLPQRVEIISAASKAFTKIHSKCKPGKEVKESVVSPQEWLMGRDTGTSSKTIYAAITGSPLRDHCHPWDPDDFGRCYRLLELFPHWKPQLFQVAARFPEWKPFVKAWPELTDLYEEEHSSGSCPKLYQRIQELIKSLDEEK